MDGEVGETTRFLDTQGLALTLVKRVQQLRKNIPPAETDLGEDCTQPGCEQLLLMLYQQWCAPEGLRHRERRATQLEAQVAFTLPAIHFYCNGERPLAQPGESPALSFRAMESLQIFGQASRHDTRLETSQRGYALESWEILDESVVGFRLAASHLHAARVQHAQLVAVRPPDAKSFLLGEVRWLRYQREGILHIGVKTFPGIPIAVGVRSPVLIASLPSKYQPAFLLPEIPALRMPPSLVLPAGFASTGRRLDVLFEETLTVELTGLLDKGVDFERVTFTPA